jgi:hypothetical protein
MYLGHLEALALSTAASENRSQRFTAALTSIQLLIDFSKRLFVRDDQSRSHQPRCVLAHSGQLSPGVAIAGATKTPTNTAIFRIGKC